MRGGDIAGLLIRQARLQRDWSQEGLCRGICAPSYLSKIEQGKAAPSPEVTELLLHRLGLVWTPEPEGLAPCWKALLSGSPNFDSLYEQLVQPRREILAFSPLAADALLLDAFYADEMRPLPVEWEPFLSTRQLALHRSLQGRWEEAVRLEPLPLLAAHYGEFLYAEGEYTAAIEVLAGRLPLGIGRRLPLPDAVLPPVDGQLLLGSGPHGGDADPLLCSGASGRSLEGYRQLVCPPLQCCLHSTGAGSTGKGPALLCLPPPPRLSGPTQAGHLPRAVGPSGAGAGRRPAGGAYGLRRNGAADAGAGALSAGAPGLPPRRYLRRPTSGLLPASARHISYGLHPLPPAVGAGVVQGQPSVPSSLPPVGGVSCKIAFLPY
ncbi:MAG: helix-turn-helix transcriptional regulator [Firmicutes bacterium]|nr:helix-turn-helix transcriptional regulator [Bacillota bacterium]